MRADSTWLLDGWMGSPRRMAWMQRNLKRLSRSSRVWDYDTSGKQSLETLAAGLARELAVQPGKVNLVGFSMGGIILREALRQNPNLPVARIACLNSPHQGTLPARLLSRAALREMRPGSFFLNRLNAHPCPVPFLNVWCPGDLVVIPGWNARQSGASEEICSWMPAHMWPILSAGLHRKIDCFLNGQDLAEQTNPNKKWQPV